ncbi:hypothetical protein [Flammeovirga aprica]|uniref:Uncharacterized protein n=1 Tax=Flammeovirga aprica JL-4 TaxID=694437 RepID=A0A7X9S1R3_9BACT|nr:hypothetical protein [Flammeovirga aprica]NME72796.1 hypothetical protein [Flammeovirga aprica JL-4]
MNAKQIKNIIVFLLSTGIITILATTITTLNKTNTWFENLQHTCVTLSLLLIVSISSLIIGTVIGYIFNIPKTNPERSSKEKFQQNRNLEKVSDWLMKMLVGIGLTQFNNIVNELFKISEYVAGSLTTLADKAEPFLVMGLLIYFLLSGFIVGYLYTNFRLIEITNASQS